MTAIPIDRPRPSGAGSVVSTAPTAAAAATSGVIEHPADKLSRLARHYDGLGFLRAIAAGDLPAPPMADLLGFEIRRIATGEVTFAYQPRLEHYNGIGMVHGGVAATLLDTVMGCAVQTLLPKDVALTTLDVTVRYLRPMTDRMRLVLATGTAVHRGRRVASAEGRIVEASTDRLLGTASATFAVLQP